MSKEKRVECVGKAQRTETELEVLIDDIRHTNLLSGDSNLIPQYEKALMQYFDVPHAIAVSSGTAALHASLAKIIQPGDEVLLPVIGVTMTASAILMAGGIPVFYDCEPDSFKPDLNSIEGLSTKKTRVLITVSMWGYPAIDEATIHFAKSKEWIVIEDAAQSFGTRNGSKFEGTKGHIGCFSTQEFKLLSTGEGGFILSDNSDHATAIRAFSRLGFSEEHKTFGYHSGLNYRLSAMQASLGLSQLAIAEEKIALRNKKVDLWKEMLGLTPSEKGKKNKLQLFNPDGLKGHNGYALCVKMASATEDAAKPILIKLFEAGVSTDIHRYKQSLLVNYAFLKPYYIAPQYTANPRVDFPNASKIMDSLISLPCHDGVDLDDIEWASKKVIDCLENIG